MNEENLNFVKCLSCGSSDFKRSVKKKDETEIREGYISCKKCNVNYTIKKGILNMIPCPSEAILTEKKENDEVIKTKRKHKDDDWLLALPLADHFGNEKYPLINKGYKANVEYIIKKISFSRKKVLEIGAGTCWTTALLAKEGAIITATDISPEKYIGLESGDVFFKEQEVYFDRVLCSMDELSFNDDTFDIVFCNAAIHHSPNIQKSFKEIARVLKSEGLYIQTNEPCCTPLNWKRRININKAREAGMDVADDWNERTYSYFDYLRFLQKNSFHKPVVEFPPSFDMILKDTSKVNVIKGYKGIIKQAISIFWSQKTIRTILKSDLFFKTSLILFGGNPLLVVKKK